MFNKKLQYAKYADIAGRYIKKNKTAPAPTGTVIDGNAVRQYTVTTVIYPKMYNLILLILYHLRDSHASGTHVLRGLLFLYKKSLS